MSKQHLYFIGLDHPAMAGMAVAVKTLGFVVSGSAPQPSRLTNQQLAKAGIHFYQDYQAQHIDPDSLIVIGPHLTKTNPELKMAQKMKLEIVSLAQLIQQISQQQKQIVVIGSPTAAALVANLLQSTSHSTDLIASQIINPTNYWLEASAVHFSAKPWLVIDSQPQPASALDKATEWLYYQPSLIVVAQSNHKRPAAFYKDLHHLMSHAKQLADPPIEPTIIAPDNDKQVAQIAKQTGLRYISYGQSPSASAHISEQVLADHTTSFKLTYHKQHLAITTDLLGHQAVADTAAALAVGCLLNIDHKHLLTALGNFNGLYFTHHLHSSDHDVHLVEIVAPWSTDAKLVFDHLRQHYLAESTARFWLIDNAHLVADDQAQLSAIDIIVNVDDQQSKQSSKSAHNTSSKVHYTIAANQAPHFIAQHLQSGDLVCYIHPDRSQLDILSHIEAAITARAHQS